MSRRDRREQVRASARVNGIDFVEVADDAQTTLRVHFLNAVPAPLSADPTIDGGETVPAVAVGPVGAAAWGTDGAHLTLTLTAVAPGDFSTYALTLRSPALDPYFSRAAFSFKARCPSRLDCDATPADCPPADEDAPPIDYLAKDFLSFRKALSDFSALRYPEWVERSEADFGVMFMEALSALADDLSYTQDRVAAEGSLETATQRRSAVRHARLVDYEPRPATAARVLLRLDVTTTTIPAGLPVSARTPDGQVVAFETGTGVVDPDTGGVRDAPEAFDVDPRWNRLDPYWWDDSQQCLERGATDMWVVGHDLGLTAGRTLLIDTRAATTADPPVRAVVRLVADGKQAVDAVFKSPDPAAGGAIGPTKVTRLRWGPADALTADHDLTRTEVAGNLVPATQGRTVTETFTIDDPPTPPADRSKAPPAAVVRAGPTGAAGAAAADEYLYTLRDGPLAWLAPPDPAAAATPAAPAAADPAGAADGDDDPDRRPVPEILLRQDGSAHPPEWRWRRTLLDAGTSDASVFTLDPARYRVVARTGGPGSGRPPADARDVYDYDDDNGYTVRFGDRTFGDTPESGATFTVTYRAGGGSAGSVAADAINRLDPTTNPAAAGVTAVSNPFPAAGGADAEPLDRVRRLAPQAFRARQFRAVRPDDYRREAETLPWVQRAGAVFRWTGSWLTAFTTPDPLGGERVTPDQRTQLVDLLNRRRMAGYESYVPDPRYVSLDLEITVCARPEAFGGDVEEAVLSALSDERRAGGSAGFFHADRFTFGTPLEPAALFAAVQAAAGVAGVTCARYRVRGATAGFLDLTGPVAVGVDQILRADNDPSRPERGSIKVTVKGGK